MEATRRFALCAALVVIGGLAGCAREAAKPEPLLQARSCTMRLAGPISGEYRCEGVLYRQEEGWVVSATLPPGLRAAGSLQVPVPAPGAVPAGGELPGGRALLRQPGRAGIGAVWGGVPRGRASVILEIGGDPASAEVAAVVPPIRANPVEEPVLVVVRLELRGPGFVAGVTEGEAIR